VSLHPRQQLRLLPPLLKRNTGDSGNRWTGCSFRDRPAANMPSIDDVGACLISMIRGKMRYREFLAHSKPRAFVVVKDGSFTKAYGREHPLGMTAMQSCRRQSHDDCEPYAVNDRWSGKKSTGASLSQPV